MNLPPASWDVHKGPDSEEKLEDDCCSGIYGAGAGMGESPGE